MFTGKLTRQDVFNRVWHHYIVEGYPYAVAFENRDGVKTPQIAIRAEKHYSPLGLLLPNSKYNKGLEQSIFVVSFNKLRPFIESHVDYDFLNKLESFYEKTVNFAFEGVNFKRVKDFYARKYRRAFRKTLRFYLIAFAMNYDLTIPGERPVTVPARKAAAYNKD